MRVFARRFTRVVSYQGAVDGTDPDGRVTPSSCQTLPGIRRSRRDRNRTSERERASHREPGKAPERECQATGRPDRGPADATTPPPHPRWRQLRAHQARVRLRSGMDPRFQPSRAFVPATPGDRSCSRHTATAAASGIPGHCDKTSAASWGLRSSTDRNTCKTTSTALIADPSLQPVPEPAYGEIRHARPSGSPAAGRGKSPSHRAPSAA